jgi:type I restriction enzyme S subunit
MKHVVRGDFESTKVRMPDIQEQKSIVDILSRAESIVRLRREAQQKAAALVPAIFRKMFGNPGSNPLSLKLRKVSDFVQQFQGGKNIQSGSEDPNGLRILKVSAVTSGRYLESESKPAPNNYVPPTSHFVRPGDMLFSRANTVDLVGATALVENTNGNTLLPDKLWRIIWSEDVDVVYMHTLFQDESVRRMLGKLATGTSDSMRNISQAKLFNLELPVASLAEQRKFGLLARRAMGMMSTQEQGLVKACQSFDSLMSNAFNS